MPVVWSYPQSSQKRHIAVRGVPQCGHGAPRPGAAAGAPAGGADTGGADTGGAETGGAETGGAETGGAEAGALTGTPPPIRAPHVSQKSSVLDA
ncbi:hypothetical protein [Krasilnikovia sp. MM14-A1004]|uniref:hypothetical protein n=1 Tax=Krasilnikovia sp. MM14-A1004 TaxID=3373541 RepID=UPI00399C9CFE